QWTRDLGDYPADVWTLSYYFRNATSKFNVTATADGTTHEVSVALATTAGYVAGWYDWTSFVTDGTSRYQVSTGRTEVLPDLANDVAYDGRTFALRMLDYIEAALESRASTDQLDLINAQLDTRSISRDKAGMIVLRDRFRAEVATEDRARRGIRSNRILAVG
ncbi:MAG: hypothetical protein ACYC42_11450, partial [Lysobacter sp.]